MNIDYSYLRRRAQFGTAFAFINDGPTVVENQLPDKSLANLYIYKNPVNKGTQEAPVMSLHEANTWRPDFSDRGMFHDQGGWPKDLNIADEEAVLRFRKKLEREDNYIASMRALTKPIEHAILQNNAINIYEKYFESEIKEYSRNESLSQIRNIYRDPKALEAVRPVSRISWSPEKTQFAACYCNVKYQMMSPQESCSAYIWNVEIPSAPELVFDSKIPIVTIEWNSNDHNLLVGGMYTGQLACYDIRKTPEHVDITPKEVSHRDPAHSALWINSKTGVEFFSTSTDGVVKWWDCRNLSQPTDHLILDLSRPQSLVNAYSASCLEYDPSIPAKFLVGTETGHIIGGNRKGATLAEKLPYLVRSHTGPVYSLMRNAAFSKMIMSVGDWSVRIWSEECRESAVMWTKNYTVQVTYGEWSKARYSAFCTARSDGVLDFWDVLLDQRKPFVTLNVSDKGLTTLKMEEHGQFLVAGDENGKCHLIQFGESLATSAKNDKNNLSAMFDRESHREKILEGRMREIRLAMKMKAQAEEPKEVVAHEQPEVFDDRPQEVIRAEEDYWDEVNKMLNAYKESGKKKEAAVEEKPPVKEEEPPQMIEEPPPPQEEEEQEEIPP